MKNIYIILSFCFLVILGACGDDRDSPSVITFTGDVEGLFTENRINDVGLYYDALVKTGLNSRLSDATERTYLVPADDAMQAALQSGGFLTVAAADVDFLTNLINDHTISGILVEDDFTKGNLTTESGKTIFVSVAGGISFNSRATISDGNQFGSNGVVHVIDFPLLDFPENDIATIVDNLANDATSPEFTVLNAALAATGLDATLGGTTEFTVFAPTDAAFGAVGLDATTVVSTFTVDSLTELLQNHVIAGRFFTLDLSSGRTYTANGAAGTAKGLDIDVASGSVSIEIDAGFTSDSESVNTLATNGVIHIVDNVVFTEAYLTEALEGTVGIDDENGAQGDLATFFAALDASTFDYDALLSTEDEYTVLAPDAYAGGSTQAALDAYIFEGAINIADAIGTRVTSIGDDEYFVGSSTSTDSDAIILYGANGSVIASSDCGGDACLQDGVTYNGNVTVLGGTGVTPLGDMSTTSVIQAGTDTLEFFAAALEFLELDSLIDQTYLAVADDTLESVLRDALAAGGVVDPDTIATADLIANIESADAATLSAVIDRHIITELFFSTDLEAGVQFSNRAGETLEVVEVTANGETTFGFLVNDDGEISTIGFVTTNVTGRNGVVHTISVPLPEQ